MLNWLQRNALGHISSFISIRVSGVIFPILMSLENLLISKKKMLRTVHLSPCDILTIISHRSLHPVSYGSLVLLFPLNLIRFFNSLPIISAIYFYTPSFLRTFRTLSASFRKKKSWGHLHLFLFSKNVNS